MDGVILIKLKEICILGVDQGSEPFTSASALRRGISSLEISRSGGRPPAVFSFMVERSREGCHLRSSGIDLRV